MTHVALKWCNQVVFFSHNFVSGIFLFIHVQILISRSCNGKLIIVKRQITWAVPYLLAGFPWSSPAGVVGTKQARPIQYHPTANLAKTLPLVPALGCLKGSMEGVCLKGDKGQGLRVQNDG
jgi:hypothetical protein